MIGDFKIGDKASFIKVFTEEDLEKFSRITTDRNGRYNFHLCLDKLIY